MPDQSRIPRKLSDFVAYMHNSAEFLFEKSAEPFDNLNWQRLGWTKEEAEQWKLFYDEAQYLSSKYSAKNTQRTVAIKDKFIQVRKSTVKYNQQHKLLDRIVSNPANTTIHDYAKFHIKRGTIMEKERTKFKKASISELVVMGIRALGGGDFIVRCLTDHESKRGKKAKGADLVILEYKVGNGETQQIISSHAKFMLRSGPSNSGKVILVRARWYNSKHPELAGPWNNWHRATIV